MTAAGVVGFALLIAATRVQGGYRAMSDLLTRDFSREAEAAFLRNFMVFTSAERALSAFAFLAIAVGAFSLPRRAGKLVGRLGILLLLLATLLDFFGRPFVQYMDVDLSTVLLRHMPSALGPLAVNMLLIVLALWFFSTGSEWRRLRSRVTIVSRRHSHSTIERVVLN